MFANRRYPPEIARLIERQLGHITRPQLLGAGCHPSWIERQVRHRDLIPVHAGVYAAGHVPHHAHPRAMAAVLACGAGSALSHDSAVALWGLGDWPAMLEVTSPGQRRRPGLRTHRSATVSHRGQTRVCLGVRVTSPARTILDVQPRRTDAGLARLINDARVAGLLGPTELARLTQHSARAADLVGDRDQRPTRSELEDMFTRFTRRHRLPMPEINAVILDGREVDALYREQQLIIELASWRFHASRQSFERDRANDVAALAAGFATVRVTERRLKRGGEAEAQFIRKIHAARGSSMEEGQP